MVTLTMVSGNVVPPTGLEKHKIREIALDVRISDERIGDVGQVAKVLHRAFGELRVPRLNRDRYKRWSAVLDGMARLSQR